MKKLLFILLAVILMSGLMLSGCAQTTTTTTTTAPAPITAAPKPTTTAPVPTTGPQYGGVLKIINKPTSFDTGFNQAAVYPSYVFARPALECLVSYDEKGTGLPVPKLATSWQYSPDYMSLTFNLRKGVKFHDGTDFNAQAAKYCLDLARTSPIIAELKSVTSVDIVDDYTIRLNLKSYATSLLASLVGPPTQMISPTYLKTLGKDVVTAPVGTGPYKFVSYQNNVSLKFERFDNYWGGKPYLDGIEWVFIADPVTSLISLKVGEAQAIRTILAKDASDLKATGKYNILTLAVNMEALAGDSKHAGSPFADIRVRQAISYAIDSEAIAKAVGYGFYLGTSQFYPPGGYAYNPAVVGYPYNPQKAKELLFQAGYPKGFETKISFQVDPPFPDVFTAVQDYLSAVGINAKLDPTDRARYEQLRSGGWDNSLILYIFANSPGQDMGAVLTRGLSSKATRYNVIDIPADYQEKLSLADVERDPQKRMAMFQELTKLIIDNYAMITPIYINNNANACSSDVHDLNVDVYSGSEWSPEKAWLSK